MDVYRYGYCFIRGNGTHKKRGVLIEDLDIIKRHCANYEDLSLEEKKIALENIYKKQRISFGYGVIENENPW